MHRGDLKNKGCHDIDMHSKDVYIKFDINSARISGFDVIDILEPVSDSLFYNSSLKLIIAGHTDSEGDEMYNMILSQNRADAVKAYFVKHGIPGQNIQTIGYGETRPVEPNDTEAGRKRNRRAEIYIVK